METEALAAAVHTDVSMWGLFMQASWIVKLYVSPTDSEHRGYYEAAKQGNLVVQRCGECNLLRGSIGAA